MKNKASDSMMDHYFDKLLHIAKFDKDVVKNKWFCEEAERRVEPLVQICIEWGKTGIPPEDTIRSYQEPSSSAQKNGKQEEKAKKSPTPPRIPPLKKTIQRKQIAKGVNILQQRLKVK